MSPGVPGLDPDHSEIEREVELVLGRAAGRRGRGLRWAAVGVVLAGVGGWAFAAGRSLGRDATVVRSPLLGRPAPAFRLATLDGGEAASGDGAGRVLVVNFWASWCVPCQREAPELDAFARRWSGRGVDVVGVVYSDSRREAVAFRDRFGVTYPQALDPGGRTALDFGVFGIPETYVIDGGGTVKAKLIGAVGPGTLDRVVASVQAGRTVTRRNEDYRTSPADP